jgi:hypothetical protein
MSTGRHIRRARSESELSALARVTFVRTDSPLGSAQGSRFALHLALSATSLQGRRSLAHRCPGERGLWMFGGQ